MDFNLHSDVDHDSFRRAIRTPSNFIGINYTIWSELTLKLLAGHSVIMIDFKICRVNSEFFPEKLIKHDQ